MFLNRRFDLSRPTGVISYLALALVLAFAAPQAAQAERIKDIAMVEDEMKIPVKVVSVGPDRAQTIQRISLFK